MPQLSTITEGKTLDTFVKELAERTNKRIKPDKIYAYIRINDDDSCFKGYVGANVYLERKEPHFLVPQDKQHWYKAMIPLAKEKFEINAPGGNFNHITLDFNDYCEDAYTITPDKEAIITARLEMVEQFIEWYELAIRAYEKEICIGHSKLLKEHLERLKIL